MFVLQKNRGVQECTYTSDGEYKAVMGMLIVVQYLINPSCELTNPPSDAPKQGDPRLDV